MSVNVCSLTNSNNGGNVLIWIRHSDNNFNYEIRIFAAVLFMLLKTSLAQTFTIPELIDLENNDIDFFDTKVIQKGYLLSKSNVDEVRYTLKDNLTMLNSIAIAYYPSAIDSSLKERCIWWIFNSESAYVKIKS